MLLRLNSNFIVAMVCAAILTAACGLLLGLPTLRLSGNYLTIVTLGFGEIVKMIIMNWDPVTNGTLGLKNIPKPEFFGEKLTLANHGLYYMMLVLVLLVSAACHVIVRSRTGRAFLAIKEDPIAATMMGINITGFKIQAFVLSAFITGIAGSFYASLVGFIDQNSFTFDVSMLIISIVIVGGMGTMRGMFLGAAILIAFPEVSRFLMDYRFVVYGLLLVLMMRFRPQGLLGWKSQMPYRMPGAAKKQLEAGV
jgi:branched-chain amino acid transport system permease protein